MCKGWFRLPPYGGGGVSACEHLDLINMSEGIDEWEDADDDNSMTHINSLLLGARMEDLIVKSSGDM